MHLEDALFGELRRSCRCQHDVLEQSLGWVLRLKIVVPKHTSFIVEDGFLGLVTLGVQYKQQKNEEICRHQTALPLHVVFEGVARYYRFSPINATIIFG